MAYRTTILADADLVDIYLHGSEVFGTTQAEQYHNALAATFELVSRHPLLAPERPEFHPPVRLHFHQAHVIVYRLEAAGDILIIRILHSRQEWERHL